jgi:hypothetical protein
MAQNRDWFIGLVKRIVTFGMQRRRKFLAQFFWL